MLMSGMLPPKGLQILYIATKNEHKVGEYRKLLRGLEVELRGLPDSVPEAPESGQSFAENALDKARFYAGHCGGPVLADDSGLCVEALGGEPGIYSARYAGVHGDDAANNRKLLERMAHLPDDQRGAEFVCAIAVVDPTSGRKWVVEGRLQGKILTEPRGTHGFGYDPLFYVPGLGRTLAELSAEDKNRISHRGRAVQALLEAWERESNACGCGE